MAEKTHKGSCHCGAVRYEVDIDLGSAIACNCSMCQRAGTLLTFVPEEKFRLLAGETNLRDYLFNNRHIHHLFCQTCGIKSFARGVSPKGGETVAVNVRCLDGVDLNALSIKNFDGKSL